MPGVLLAVRKVGGLPDHFTVGLEKLLSPAPRPVEGYPEGVKAIRGIITALATPFDESGAVDVDARVGDSPRICSSTARTGW